MKGRMLLLVAAAALVSSVASAAGVNRVGVNGGFGVPFGDFGDASKAGVYIGVLGEHALSGHLGVGADLTFNRHGIKDIPALYGGGNVDGSFRPILLGVHGTYRLPTSGQAAPYLQAGVGAYLVKTKIDATSSFPAQDHSDTNFGFNLGGGIDLGSGHALTLGVETMLHYVSGDRSGEYLNLGLHALFGIGGGK